MARGVIYVAIVATGSTTGAVPERVCEGLAFHIAYIARATEKTCSPDREINGIP